MRVGRNPNSSSDIEPLPEILAAVITHLPNQEGYFAERLEIIKICLNSIRANAGRDLPILVWDNGSCLELRQWLLEEYQPEYMVLSKNQGINSAKAVIFEMFLPDTIVCLSDDDMLHMENWLDPQLELLNHFPNVGIVSGTPCNSHFRYGNTYTLKWARQNANVEEGHFIPEEWERDFARAIGWDEESHLMNVARQTEYRITYKGVSVYAEAHHQQMIGYAGKLRPFFPRTDSVMKGAKRFDRMVDKAKLLRLTTTERLVLHMGNVLEPKLRKLIEGR